MKRLIFVLVVLIGSSLAWATSLAAQNGENEPTAVGLLYFTAAVQANGVRLDWGTATELNTAGFTIQRSSSGGSFATLDGIGFIPSTGGVATGATYSVVDTTAVPGQTYTYKLVELETNSSQHDLEVVTVTFNPQPTATSIIIGGTNPTPTPGSTPAAVTNTPTATAIGTAVPTQNSSQPTPTPQATAIPTNAGTNSSLPANTLQIPPTTAPRLDQAFDGSAGSGGAASGVAFAQEEPSPAAYPGPGDPAPGDPTESDFYPDGQEPAAEIAPENPTPYPASTGGSAVPTLAVIGSSDPYPPETDTAAPAPSAEVIRGRILLWAGFLIALFIFLSGIVGAIVLYRRRPD